VILILLRVNGLDHEMEVRMRKMKERMKKRELMRKMSTRKMSTRKMSTRKMKGKMMKMMKMMKKLRVALKKSRKITMATEVLDTGAKMSTKKKTGLMTSVLLWMSF